MKPRYRTIKEPAVPSERITMEQAREAARKVAQERRKGGKSERKVKGSQGE